MNLTLNRTHDASYPRLAVQIHVEAPGNYVASEVVCRSSSLDEKMCAEPFQEGEAWEAGQTLWTPCGVPGPHRVQVTIENTTVLDRLLDCEEAPDTGSEERPELSATAMDTDQDGNNDWLNLTLTQAPTALYPRSEVQVEAQGPENTTSLPCNSQSLDKDTGTCQDPFQNGDTWDKGATKWLPCAAHGPHHVQVTIRNDTVLDRELLCEEPAEESITPESASVTAQLESENGQEDSWIRIGLVEGENAPYEESEVSYNISDPSGERYEDQGPDSGDSDDILCTLPEAANGACDGSDFHQGPHRNRWSVDTALYVPCQEAGEHELEIRLLATTVLETTMTCESAA